MQEVRKQDRASARQQISIKPGSNRLTSLYRLNSIAINFATPTANITSTFDTTIRLLFFI